MTLYNILNQLAVLRTWLWLPKSVKEISCCASVGVHCFLFLWMIWLHNRPIQLVIAPGMNAVPVMCVEESVVLKESAKNIPPKIVQPPKRTGLKEPVIKKAVPPKKKQVQKVVPKKEIPKPQVVKKEIKPQPEPEKKITPVVEKKALDVINVNLVSSDTTEVGALVHNALQSSWSPPIGITPKQACVIQIALKQDGTLGTLSIEQSSGIPAYDLAAKSAVAKTKFPKQLWNRSIRFSFI